MTCILSSNKPRGVVLKAGAWGPPLNIFQVQVQIGYSRYYVVKTREVDSRTTCIIYMHLFDDDNI